MAHDAGPGGSSRRTCSFECSAASGDRYLSWIASIASSSSRGSASSLNALIASSHCWTVVVPVTTTAL